MPHLRTQNGAVTEANVYVSTDNGETYTKVANVTWSYEGETIPTEKSVEFEPVAGVTHVKFEAIHSEGAIKGKDKTAFPLLD